MLTDIPPLQTIRGLSNAIYQRDLSCEDTVRQCLAQIDEHEERLRAWVVLDRDGAIAQAQALDREMNSGNYRGPLHGVPLGIKDIIDVAGFVTGAGSPFMARLPVANQDAVVVSALRQAGAVIVGKTVTTQFASFDPPVTRNPWNPDRTPGGSSSGSAAAVGAGTIPGAIGSQTGGSITRPAAFCGAAGCKPTHGTVPLEGILPLAPSMDHPGPIARTVDDLSILLAVLQGRMAQIVDIEKFDYVPLRIGRLRGFFEDRTDPEMLAAMDDVLNRWRQAGATIVDVPVPSEFDDVLKHHRAIMACEAAAWHREYFAQHRTEYGPCIAQLIEEGLATSGVDYLKARERQGTLARAMENLLESGLHALATPAATGAAPDPSTTGNPCMNAPWSFTGQPTVSFPIAMTSDGMPLSIQLAGLRHHDSDLLEVSAWGEHVPRR